MEGTRTHLPESALAIITRVALLYTLFALLSLSFSFVGGVFRYEPWTLLYSIMGWLQAALIALTAEYSRRLVSGPKTALADTFFLGMPAFAQLFADASQFLFVRSGPAFSIAQSFLISSYVIDYFVFFIIGRWLLLAHRNKGQSTDQGETRSTQAVVVEGEDLAPELKKDITRLGAGEGSVDRVINSVIWRSIKSERIATFSLRVMIILVIVGSMASFGLWIFTHADRISLLEAEQTRLVRLQGEVKDLKDKLGAGATDEIKAQLDRVNKVIADNYSNEQSFKETMDRLNLQSQTNYADIAIRVTIAVLTIFLVQVFFSVYKYNRHLAIMLAAKAEALELAGSDETARKELSREAITIVKESIPGFGAHPKTPLEQIAQAFERVRGRE